MAYQSLYRKYRPQTFVDVVGQTHVTRTLQNALASGRIAHGYLFTGTRGTAKTTVARLLAKALNCESGTGPVPEPCNVCDACQSITAGTCIDVIELDAASHRGVADIEEVRKAVGYGPMQFRYKVFIIDEAHQLSNDAKDAFLKTLEEPPPGVVFVLATTEPQSIPITIRSRCQQFDFKRGSLADLTGRLAYVLDAEGVTYTPEALGLIARSAEGSYRDALSLLEQALAFSPDRLGAVEVETVLGALDAATLSRIIDAAAQRDAPMAFSLAAEVMDAGKEARTVLKALAGRFRDLLLASVGGPAAAQELNPDEVSLLQAQARAFRPEQMIRAIDILQEAQNETRFHNQHRLLLEMALLKLMALGEASSAPLVTAPIVFGSAAPARVEPAPPVAPVPAPKTVTAPPPPPAEESLPVGFFADEETAADEEDERDLFAEAPEPSAPMVEAPARPEPEPFVSPPAAPSTPYTLEQVQRAWPRFLTEAGHISKQTETLMAGALPTAVDGNTIVLTFSVRANHDLMSPPKKQEFVRKLLARCLDLEDETVPVRFVLDDGQLTLQRTVVREKIRRDPLAEVDALKRSQPAPTPTPFPLSPEPARPMPAPSAAPPADEPSAPRGSGVVAALEEPLVQEALSIFGGEIVVDRSV